MLADPNAEFTPSFFSEQLTAFQLWLAHGSADKRPPEQLPIVLQVCGISELVFPGGGGGGCRIRVVWSNVRQLVMRGGGHGAMSCGSSWVRVLASSSLIVLHVVLPIVQPLCTHTSQHTHTTLTVFLSVCLSL